MVPGQNAPSERPLSTVPVGGTAGPVIPTLVIPTMAPPRPAGN